ncbi:hypothetical protein CHLNCDRAFT_143009 [Chlorella variabilis]|uniref:Uncharacterized protein n=1 Tax=Chlorella variabilis TaxID=554065 RepID=E1Z9A4_CHLVA|nr:hypothetical protein CHLNCDRAFT_143009 [Chlorella variabilis]EFN57483.1 hypothetical protein CHLNCDRAFT_143009 [Chlorella variabilis]|eukprot:XP_005849585.1 hypothetical protein CHLNCDRAFT_143009 [Chlorella variabilis]
MSNSTQQQASTAGEPAPASAAAGAAHNGGARSSGCPPHVLAAIYGKMENKKEALDKSLQRWWSEYADRKNDEEDEHVADSLLYDRNHLPRTAPAPDCVQRAMQRPPAAGGAAGQAAQAAAQPPAGAAPPT